MPTQNTNSNGGSSLVCLLKSKRNQIVATLFNKFFLMAQRTSNTLSTSNEANVSGMSGKLKISRSRSETHELFQDASINR